MASNDNDWVEIYHPILDQSATVHRRSVYQHEKAGWRLRVPDPPPPEVQDQQTKPSAKRRGLSHASRNPDVEPDNTEGE